MFCYWFEKHLMEKNIKGIREIFASSDQELEFGVQNYLFKDISSKDVDKVFKELGQIQQIDIGIFVDKL